MLRIRDKSLGSGFGSGSGLKLVSYPDLVSDPDLNPGFDSGSESLDPDLDQKVTKFFFVLKFLRSLSHIYAYCLCIHVQ
jgi:hypothetical protein